MSVIKIKNSKEMSSKEFQQALQEAWENGSPLDDLLEITWQLAELTEIQHKVSRVYRKIQAW